MSEAKAPPTVVEITSLDQFAALLAHWHKHTTAVLEHMLQVPEGTELTMDNKPPVIMTGPFRDGFCAGLSLALIEFGNLPFVLNSEDTKPNAPTKH